jgi:hypothetical protein
VGLAEQFLRRNRVTLRLADLIRTADVLSRPGNMARQDRLDDFTKSIQALLGEFKAQRPKLVALPEPDKEDDEQEGRARRLQHYLDRHVAKKNQYDSADYRNDLCMALKWNGVPRSKEEKGDRNVVLSPILTRTRYFYHALAEAVEGTGRHLRLSDSPPGGGAADGRLCAGFRGHTESLEETLQRKG